MAETYTQRHRPLEITTPLGTDVLLLRGFSGEEAISSLFHFNIDLFAENHRQVSFETVLGRKSTISVRLPGGKKRYLNGIIHRISRGERGPDFTAYRAEMVPEFWTLTRKFQSRIFQHITIPDILKKVLEGLDVAWEIQGTFHPRDFCVQYMESDFNFACRLMEEEGIYFFFKHASDTHTMVVANTPQSHPEMPHQPKVIYEELTGGDKDDMRVTAWEKVQEVRSGKFTLWDHCFELPHKHLDADKQTKDSVQVGSASHKLRVGGNDKFELYEWKGKYAQRFDGIDKGGGERPDDLQKIFQDNKRTVEIRMQQEETPAVTIQGASNCRHFVTGHKFNLERHFQDNGTYLITHLQHFCDQVEQYRTSQAPGTMNYANQITCVPIAVPFKPPRVTPRPTMHGTQTAVVVGPPGEEIFPDKYGRVKVQFHWDRDGKNDLDSSCWIRVGTMWAGKNWGAIHIPRIGQEVLVDFIEGDPDQPIIVGSVYNADMMPPYKLPDKKTVATLKSRSSKGGSPSNFNEIRMEDLKGKEQLFIHGERDMDLRVKHDRREITMNERHTIVESNQKALIKGNHESHVKGNFVEKIDGKHSQTVGQSLEQKVGTKLASDVGQEIHLKAGMKVVIEAGVELTIKGAGGFIKIDPAGVTIVGMMVNINSGGAPGTGSGSSPDSPSDPDIADDVTKFDKM